MNIDIKIGNEHILKDFPNFDYRNPCDSALIDFNKPGNIVGNQQRAFVLWCILRYITINDAKAGVSIACGQLIEPFCIGLDKYYGDAHPQYGGIYKPQLTWDCNTLPFNDNTIPFIVANHALEHFYDIKAVFQECVRVLEPDGYLIIIIPDGRYEPSGGWDSDHKQCLIPEQFVINVLDHFVIEMHTEIFDDFNNHFSFNYLGIKRPIIT